MAALIGLLSEPCFACKCVPTAPEQLRNRADVVFTGEVIDFRSRWARPLSEATARELLDLSSYPHYDSVAFRVGHVYKGRVHETQWLRGQGDSASCGFRFELGRTYTVFADGDDGGELETGLCDGVFQDTFDPSAFAFESSYGPLSGTDVNDAQGYARWILAFAIPASIAILFFAGRRLLRWLVPKLRGA